MNALAQQLNETLDNTVAARLFSDLGTRMYFPKGIVAQAAEAKSRANRFNATVGMAYEAGEPMRLPAISEAFPTLSPAESVAYSPTAGSRALRDAWKEQIVQKNPGLSDATFSLPIVVPGLTSGISVAADLFAEPGDTLIVPDLFWGNYRLIFEERRQCTLDEFPFFDDTGVFNRAAFSTAVEAGIQRGKVMVILNFPNNPAGFTPTIDDAKSIVETLVAAADRAPVVLISDDAYFGLFYEADCFTESLFSSLANAHENLLAIKVDGATKEDFVWGFRVGFLSYAWKGISVEQMGALEQKTMGAIRSTVSSSSTPSQNLLLHLYTNPDYANQKTKAAQILTERYETLKTILDAKKESGRAPALDPLPCNSGYFMSFRCRGIGAEALRLSLLERGIGTISVKDTYLRVAFAGIDKEHLEELYDEIFACAEELSSPS